MMARSFAALALWVVVAVAVACSEDAYNGPCGVDDGCGAGASAGPGGAVCPNPEEARCCPDGGQSCAAEAFACRPKEQCASTKCVSDDTCPGPPDHRCGVGRCKNGACELETWPSKQIPNQYPGDCKVNVCAPDGSLAVWTDPSDVPDDGNLCTADVCEADEPSNTKLPDKWPCPGDMNGVCVDGSCRDCFEILDAEECPSQTNCDYDTCVPIQCVDPVWDPDEADFNCGGPKCRPCSENDFCNVGSDCNTGVCQGGKCQAPSHADGLKNGDETGVDCGYPGEPPNACNDGEGCLSAADCKSAVCYLGVCQAPTCTDATKNGSETGPDCGGKDCEPCPS